MVVKTLMATQQLVGTSFSLLRQGPMLIYYFVLMFFKQILSVFTYHIFTPQMNPMHNEIALIIGCDTPMGRAFATRIAKLDGTVICIDTSKEKGTTLVKCINDEVGEEKAFFYLGDVRKEESLVDAIEEVTREIGDISIVINCAPKKLLISSYVTVYRALLPIMKGNKKGHFVFIKSFGSDSRRIVENLYESINRSLKQADARNVRTTLASVFPKIDKDGEKNPMFGNIKPDLLAEEVLDGVARNRKEVFLPEYMVYTSVWFRLLPSGISNMIDDILFNAKR